MDDVSELIMVNAICRAADKLTVRFDNTLLQTGKAFSIKSSYSLGTTITIERNGIMTANLEDLKECRLLVNFFPLSVYKFQVKKGDIVRLISISEDKPDVILSLIHEERDGIEKEAIAG